MATYVLNQYLFEAPPDFKWLIHARSPEEAEAQFRSNLAVIMRQSDAAELRSKAARALRRKTFKVTMP